MKVTHLLLHRVPEGAKQSRFIPRNDEELNEVLCHLNLDSSIAIIEFLPPLRYT